MVKDKEDGIRKDIDKCKPTCKVIDGVMYDIE